MIKRPFLGASALALCACVSANAAAQSIYSSAPAHDWVGFFVGVSAGGPIYAFTNHTFVDATAKTGRVPVNGWLAGATFGFNFQDGPLVWGMEADLSWSNVGGNKTLTGVPGFGTATFSTEMEWLFLARTRFGYSFGRFVPFISAGPAFGSVKISSPIPGAGIVSASQTRAGWTLGAGFDYAVTPRMSVRVEYLYVCLGDAVLLSASTVGYMGHFARAAVNYKLDWFGFGDTVAASVPTRALTTTSAYEWTGLYAGFNYGGSWGVLDTTILLNGVVIGNRTEKSNGGFGIGLHGLYGLQGGYNWQMGRFLIGAEADIQRTQFWGQSPESSFAVVAGGLTSTLQRTTAMPTLGTIRARAGITFDRWLFYVTGGLAYGEVATFSVLSVPGFGTARASSQQTSLGWIGGFGIEGSLWKSWSVKFEYLYADLGHVDTSFLGVGPVGLISTRSSVNEQVLRVGLNYRFGGQANQQFH